MLKAPTKITAFTCFLRLLELKGCVVFSFNYGFQR